MSMLMETEGLSVRPSLDGCVKCTICESACPYAAVTERFPGPKTVGPQEERFRHGPLSADWSVDYCSGCGICSRVCPQEVRIAEINSRARAQLKERKGIPLRDQLLARPDWMGRLSRPVGPLFNWSMSTPLVRIPVEKTIGIHRKAAIPKVQPRTFQRWARHHTPPARTDRVVYFHGCSTNYYEARLGRMVVAVLERQGFAVEIPAQGCCGLPAQSNGNFPVARTYVTRLARQLRRSTKGIPVIASSTSCGLMLKREAREILDIEDPALVDISTRTWDIFEFLRDLHEQGRLDTRFQPVEVTAAYHAPCQQQNQLIGKPALDVLALVPGLRLIELDRDCCGVGGTYGLKREKYPISMAVGDGLFSDIRDAAPDLVLCDSETCRWHIAKATGFPVVHPLELLFRAYGGH